MFFRLKLLEFKQAIKIVYISSMIKVE